MTAITMAMQPLYSICNPNTLLFYYQSSPLESESFIEPYVFKCLLVVEYAKYRFPPQTMHIHRYRRSAVAIALTTRTPLNGIAHVLEISPTVTIIFLSPRCPIILEERRGLRRKKGRVTWKPFSVLYARRTSNLLMK